MVETVTAKVTVEAAAARTDLDEEEFATTHIWIQMPMTHLRHPDESITDTHSDVMVDLETKLGTHLDQGQAQEKTHSNDSQLIKVINLVIKEHTLKFKQTAEQIRTMNQTHKIKSHSPDPLEWSQCKLDQQTNFSHFHLYHNNYKCKDSIIRTYNSLYSIYNIIYIP